MFHFLKKEVYIGFSEKDFSSVRETLEQNHIRYTYAVENNGYQPNARSTGAFPGSVGVDLEFGRMYRIFVKPADYETAQYFVQQALHS